HTLHIPALIPRPPTTTLFPYTTLFRSLYKPAENSVKDFVAMIEELKQDLTNGRKLINITKKLLKRSGYMKSLVEENSPKSMTRRENILELQNAISYYEKNNNNASLSSFLQEISLITDSDKYDED